MKFFTRFVTVCLLLGLTVWAGTAFAKSDSSDRPGFTAADDEFYLSDDIYYFFRPGVDIEVIDYEIPSDGQPLVTFSLKDPGGMPLDIDGVYTPGAVNVRMNLTYIPQGEEDKVNYSGSGFAYDRGGVFTSLGNGVYTYKFATVLPADYDTDATHTLAATARRDLRDFDLDRYSDNDLVNFVPSGADMVTPVRDIVRTETCNRCHDPLAFHGSLFTEVQFCQQCHNPSLVDEEAGVSYNMDVMTHRIHAEAAEYPVPINDCEVCHTGGTPTADFPLVANPQPTPACESSGVGTTTLTWGDAGPITLNLDSPDGWAVTSRGEAGSFTSGPWVNDAMTFFLVDANSGDVIQSVTPHTTVFGCANNPPGVFQGEAGDLHTRWLNRPSREVCSSCHTDVDFEQGTNHPEQTTDEFCGYCHQPSGREYGASIRGAHQVDYKSAQLGGVLVQILDVSNTGPGQRPIVTFSLSNKWGPLPPSFLQRLNFSLSGPNDDFAFYAQDSAIGALVADGANWKFQFETPLPSDAMGSFSIGVEGRIGGWVMNPGSNDEFTMNDQMQNFLEPFTVTGDVLNPRRMVVDDMKCESCHDNLSLHGSNRHDAGGYCQTCHMPSATDHEVRPEGEGAPQSIDFRYMVHKIHRGAELENGYSVYGYRSSFHDYSHVEYPGDLRNCEACHVEGSYTLPLPTNLEMVETPRDFFSPMGAETAACLSCHDSQAAASHALSNSSDVGEACAACHGDGKAYDVMKVHAR